MPNTHKQSNRSATKHRKQTCLHDDDNNDDDDDDDDENKQSNFDRLKSLTFGLETTNFDRLKIVTSFVLETIVIESRMPGSVGVEEGGGKEVGGGGGGAPKKEEGGGIRPEDMAEI